MDLYLEDMCGFERNSNEVGYKGVRKPTTILNT